MRTCIAVSWSSWSAYVLFSSSPRTGHMRSMLTRIKQNSMNNRANIMYFIEHLCDMATREGHADYVRMMQRDILRIVDAVAPEDGSGAANVKVVRKVYRPLSSPSPPLNHN